MDKEIDKIGTIKAVCISESRGTPKKDVKSAMLKVGWGVEGDAHGGDWHRQVSLISYDKVLQFNEAGAGVSHGDFGENIVVSGIDFRELPIGTKLICNDGILQITQKGKQCHSHCQIYHKMGDCIMPREGVFAKVVKSGTISAGDTMQYIKFTAAVLTISDKGSTGERTDESGPIIVKMLEDAGYHVIGPSIIPDDQSVIEDKLIDFADNQKVDLILTTGGTGFSRRDITPEATTAVSHRMVPGIAEAMRASSLQITGRAMLSRGVSSIRGKTLIVNLPGSPKAARENLAFILPHLAHGLEILRGTAQDCAVRQ